MDFEFLTDVPGEPLAKCDVESEYFGDWLSHDIGADTVAVATLMAAIEKLLTRQQMEFEYTGKIYHLMIADDEVELFLNNTELNHSEFDEDLAEGPVSGCGLMDFANLLENWLAFIR